MAKDTKTAQVRLLDRQIVKPSIREIDYPVAADADQVMMIVEIGVKAGLIAESMNSID